MAELATIARPYAEALFQAAKADPAAAAAWLDELAAIASNEQLRQYADSPKVSASQVLEALQAQYRPTPEPGHYLDWLGRRIALAGTADAEGNAIYSEAFGCDPDFFAFTQSLTSYERALQPGNSSIVMAPDSEFFDYLRSDLGRPAAAQP